MSAPIRRGWGSFLGHSISVATTNVAQSIERAKATGRLATHTTTSHGHLSQTIATAGVVAGELTTGLVDILPPGDSGLWDVRVTFALGSGEWAGVVQFGPSQGDATDAIIDKRVDSALGVGRGQTSWLMGAEGAQAGASYSPDETPDTWPTLTMTVRSWKLD